MKVSQEKLTGAVQNFIGNSQLASKKDLKNFIQDVSNDVNEVKKNSVNFLVIPYKQLIPYQVTLTSNIKL
jgi:pantothenate synthetase